MQIIAGTNPFFDSEVSLRKAAGKGWVHLALSSQRAGKTTIYINGKAKGTLDLSKFKETDLGKHIRTGHAARFDAIGAQTQAGTFGPRNFYHGAMDEFMIFTCALSKQDIRKILKQ